MLTGWIVRLIDLVIIALVARLLVNGLRVAITRLNQTTSSGSSVRGNSKSGVALVKDPVCGVYLEPARAVSMRLGSNVY